VDRGMEIRSRTSSAIGVSAWTPGRRSPGKAIFRGKREQRSKIVSTPATEWSREVQRCAAARY
jgi:hypothetical protein